MKLHNGFTKFLVVAGLASCSSLSAAIITFSTTGTFSNSGVSSETSNGVTLTFLATLPTMINTTTSSFVGFGDILVATTSTALVPLPSGLMLTINIAQTGPTVGNASLTGTLTGSISSNSSAAVFTPTTSTVSIGGVTYAFTQASTALVPPSSNGGDVSIQGIVTPPSAVPEPGTTVSLLSGVFLLGAGGALKLRRRV